MNAVKRRVSRLEDKLGMTKRRPVCEDHISDALLRCGPF